MQPAKNALRVLGIFALIVIVVIVSRYQIKLVETERLLKKWIVRLDGQLVESGEYRRWEEPTLPDQDGWGTFLRVAYAKEDDDFESVTVTSAGPDREFETDDDLRRIARTGHLKAASQVAAKTVEETGRNWGKGLVRGIKEGIRPKRE